VRCRRLGFCAGVVALAAGSAGAGQARGTQTGGAQAPPLVSGACAQPSTAHDVTIALESEGQVRSAVLHLPDAARGRALALLIAFHGWGSSGAQFERETGFDAVANRRGFAVLYPSSAGSHWQISGPPTDVTFTIRLLARVEAVACVDRRRVYATGLSNGAGMAARLSCEASLQIAGAVPLAGYYSSRAPCDPVRPVSLLEIHGTDDNVVPYHGTGADGGEGALSFAAAWAARDGCASNPIKTAFAPRVALYRWNGCVDGARVEQLTLYGVGHGMPDAPGHRIRAPGPPTISVIGVVWSFLAPIVLTAPPAQGHQGSPLK
jgi:polyhydroxybutyrate depolymerase